MSQAPLKVAVIGAGPAGIYASDILVKKTGGNVEIDLIEQMPAPFGLIRYGVAPDHPRIKGIVNSLHRVLETEQIRLISNVHVGRDLTVAQLQEHYDAVVFATGAVGDRNLDVPGADLEGVHGAGEFVGFYDGNPRFNREWDLSAKEVAVVGVGNVGLDVARILAKTGDELKVTEIPDNVYDSLAKNQAETVRVFGRRGPAQASSLRSSSRSWTTPRPSTLLSTQKTSTTTKLLSKHVQTLSPRIWSARPSRATPSASRRMRRTPCRFTSSSSRSKSSARTARSPASRPNARS